MYIEYRMIDWKGKGITSSKSHNFIINIIRSACHYLYPNDLLTYETTTAFFLYLLINNKDLLKQTCARTHILARNPKPTPAAVVDLTLFALAPKTIYSIDTLKTISVSIFCSTDKTVICLRQFHIDSEVFHLFSINFQP